MKGSKDITEDVIITIAVSRVRAPFFLDVVDELGSNFPVIRLCGLDKWTKSTVVVTPRMGFLKDSSDVPQLLSFTHDPVLLYMVCQSFPISASRVGVDCGCHLHP